MRLFFLLKINLILSILFISSPQAGIVEINNIDEVRPYITQNALFLFDIDDTLITNPLSCGSPLWRSWIKSEITKNHPNCSLYDALTFFIAKNVPCKTVESSTAHLIADLQNGGHVVLAFTARGRFQWYSTKIDELDRFTDEQLKHVGIDFEKTLIPKELSALDPYYFYKGIIFSNEQHLKKGDLMKHLFKDVKYTPSLIVFVDDKLDQVQSVESAVKEAGIPFIGFWYRRSEFDRKLLNTMIANVQLESLLFQGEVIDDEAALEIAKTKQQDPSTYFKEILTQKLTAAMQSLLLSLPLHRGALPDGPKQYSAMRDRLIFFL